MDSFFSCIKNKLMDSTNPSFIISSRTRSFKFLFKTWLFVLRKALTLKKRANEQKLPHATQTKATRNARQIDVPLCF